MADKNLGDLIFDLALDDSKFQAAITRSVDTIKKFNTTIAGLGSASVGGGVEGIVTKQDEVMAKISDYFAMMQKRQEMMEASAVSRGEAAKERAAARAEKRAQKEAEAVIKAEQKKQKAAEHAAKRAELDAERKARIVASAAAKEAKEVEKSEDRKRKEAERTRIKAEREVKKQADAAIREAKRAEREVQRAEAKRAAQLEAATKRAEREAKKQADAAIREAKRAQAVSARSSGAAPGRAASADQITGMLTNIEQRMSSAATIIGAAAAAIAGSIAYIGASFQNTINQVAVLSGDPAVGLPALTEAARDFGRTTQFSAKDAADAMLNFAQAGMTAEENIAATDSAIKLAAASGSDLSLSTSIMSDAISQFNMNTGEAADLADIFAYALNDSKLGMSDLSVSMRYAGTVGAGFGMTVKQTTAALMMFSNLGLKGSKAGTVFRQAMESASNTTAEADKVLAKYNLTQADISPTAKNFGQILDTVAAAQIDVTDAIQIFGVQSGAAVAALARMQAESAGTGKSFEDLVKKMDIAVATGLASTTASQMMMTVQQTFEKTVSAIQDIAIGIFYAFAEPLRLLLVEVTGVTDLIGSDFAYVSGVIEATVGRAIASLTAYISENRDQIASAISAAVVGLSDIGARLISFGPTLFQIGTALLNLVTGVLRLVDEFARLLPFVDNAVELFTALFVVNRVIAFNAALTGVVTWMVKLYEATTVATEAMTLMEVTRAALTGGFPGLAKAILGVVAALTIYIATSAEAELAADRLTAARERQRMLDDKAAQEETDRVAALLAAAQDRALKEQSSGVVISEARQKEIDTLLELDDVTAKLLIGQGKLIVSQNELRTTAALTEEGFNSASYGNLQQAYAGIRDETQALQKRIEALAPAVKKHTDIVSGAYSNMRETSETAGGAIAASTGEDVSNLEEAAQLLTSLQSALKGKQAQLSKTKIEAVKAEAGIRKEADQAAPAVKRLAGANSEAAKAAKEAADAHNAEVDALQRLIDEAQKRYDEVIRGLQEVSASEAELQADRIAAQIEADNAMYDAAAIAAAALHDATVDWEQRKQESAAKIRATYGIKSLNEARALAKKAQDDLFAATASEGEIRQTARDKELNDLNAQFDAQVVLNEGQGVLLKGIEEQRTAAIAATKARHNAEDLAREKKHGDDLVAVALGVSDELAALAQKGVAGLLGGGPIFGGMFAAMGMAQTDAQTQAQTAINEILDKGVKDYRDANKDKGISDQDAAAYRVQLEKDSEGQIAQIQDVARKQGTKNAHQQMMTIFANSKVLGAAYQILWNKVFKLNDKAARGLDYFVVGLSKGIKGIASGFQGVMKIVEQISGFSLNVLGIIQDAISFVQSEQKAAIEDASARAKAAGFDPAAAERRAAAATNPADMATKFVENLVGGAVRITQMFVAVVGPVISELAAQLPSLFTAVADAIPQIVTAFAQNIGPLVAAIVEGVPKVALALIDAIPAIATALIEAILYDILPALPEIAWNLVTAIWTALWETLKAAGGAIGNWFAGLFRGDAEGGPAAYSGMDYVPSTMRATLHQGEAVIPADRNARRLRGATAPAPAGADQNYGGRGGMGGFGPLEVSVIAEGRLLEAVQLRAEDMGRATGMAKRIRKAAGTKVGFSRGDYNPWSR